MRSPATMRIISRKRRTSGTSLRALHTKTPRVTNGMTKPIAHSRSPQREMSRRWDPIGPMPIIRSRTALHGPNRSCAPSRSTDTRKPMNWLIKEEPEHYSFDDLVRDGRTSWSGVRNPLAQKHLQTMRKGDRIFFYHTGAVKAVVGVAKAAGAPYPDPADPSGKLHAVDVAPVKKLKSPVTLSAVKADKAF